MNAKFSDHADRMGTFTPGQKVSTSFGPGVVSGFSEIDCIVYVALGSDHNVTYVLRPEQVERMDG